MSMDDVMSALKAFERDLDGFTTALQSAVTTLEREHDRTSLLWRDSFSKVYHGRWEAFSAPMGRYLKHDAPKYASFLKTKIRDLARYLGHG
jgi:hypothetical protein